MAPMLMPLMLFAMLPSMLRVAMLALSRVMMLLLLHDLPPDIALLISFTCYAFICHVIRYFEYIALCHMLPIACSLYRWCCFRAQCAARCAPYDMLIFDAIIIMMFDFAMMAMSLIFWLHAAPRRLLLFLRDAVAIDISLCSCCLMLIFSLWCARVHARCFFPLRFRVLWCLLLFYFYAAFDTRILFYIDIISLIYHDILLLFSLPFFLYAILRERRCADFIILRDDAPCAFTRSRWRPSSHVILCLRYGGCCSAAYDYYWCWYIYAMPRRLLPAPAICRASIAFFTIYAFRSIWRKERDIFIFMFIRGILRYFVFILLATPLTAMRLFAYMFAFFFSTLFCFPVLMLPLFMPRRFATFAIAYALSIIDIFFVTMSAPRFSAPLICYVYVMPYYFFFSRHAMLYADYHHYALPRHMPSPSAACCCLPYACLLFSRYVLRRCSILWCRAIDATPLLLLIIYSPLHAIYMLAIIFIRLLMLWLWCLRYFRHYFSRLLPSFTCLPLPLCRHAIMMRPCPARVRMSARFRDMMSLIVPWVRRCALKRHIDIMLYESYAACSSRVFTIIMPDLFARCLDMLICAPVRYLLSLFFLPAPPSMRRRAILRPRVCALRRPCRCLSPPRDAPRAAAYCCASGYWCSFSMPRDNITRLICFCLFRCSLLSFAIIITLIGRFMLPLSCHVYSAAARYAYYWCFRCSAAPCSAFVAICLYAAFSPCYSFAYAVSLAAPYATQTLFFFFVSRYFFAMPLYACFQLFHYLLPLFCYLDICCLLFPALWLLILSRCALCRLLLLILIAVVTRLMLTLRACHWSPMLILLLLRLMFPRYCRCYFALCCCLPSLRYYAIIDIDAHAIYLHACLTPRHAACLFSAPRRYARYGDITPWYHMLHLMLLFLMIFTMLLMLSFSYACSLRYAQRRVWCDMLYIFMVFRCATALYAPTLICLMLPWCFRAAIICYYLRLFRRFRVYLRRSLWYCCHIMPAYFIYRFIRYCRAIVAYEPAPCLYSATPLILPDVCRYATPDACSPADLRYFCRYCRHVAMLLIQMALICRYAPDYFLRVCAAIVLIMPSVWYSFLTLSKMRCRAMRATWRVPEHAVKICYLSRHDKELVDLSILRVYSDILCSLFCFVAAISPWAYVALCWYRHAPRYYFTPRYYYAMMLRRALFIDCHAMRRALYMQRCRALLCYHTAIFSHAALCRYEHDFDMMLAYLFFFAMMRRSRCSVYIHARFDMLIYMPLCHTAVAIMAALMRHVCCWCALMPDAAMPTDAACFDSVALYYATLCLLYMLRVDSSCLRAMRDKELRAVTALFIAAIFAWYVVCHVLICYWLRCSFSCLPRLIFADLPLTPRHAPIISLFVMPTRVILRCSAILSLVFCYAAADVTPPFMIPRCSLSLLAGRCHYFHAAHVVTDFFRCLSMREAYVYTARWYDATVSYVWRYAIHDMFFSTARASIATIICYYVAICCSLLRLFFCRAHAAY